MDKLGLFGFVLAFASIFLAESLTGGAIGFLLNGPAFLIVFGGTLGAVLIQTPAAQFKHAIQQLPKVFVSPKFEMQAQVARILVWSNKARQHGFLALENISQDKKLDALTQYGLAMVVDGVEVSKLRSLLEQKVDLEQEYYEKSTKVFDAMGGYSPTMGIIGAVLGLIQAMALLDSPTTLGPAIGVAFVATIYGVGFANFIYLPIAHKLRSVYYRQALYQEMTIEGLLAIVNGDNGLTIKRRLDSFNVEGGGK